jgi:hypothetical protein
MFGAPSALIFCRTGLALGVFLLSHAACFGGLTISLLLSPSRHLLIDALPAGADCLFDFSL